MGASESEEERREEESEDEVIARAKEFLEKLQEWKRTGLPLIRPKHAE